MGGGKGKKSGMAGFGMGFDMFEMMKEMEKMEK